jgi:hypothetical protein
MTSLHGKFSKIISSPHELSETDKDFLQKVNRIERKIESGERVSDDDINFVSQCYFDYNAIEKDYTVVYFFTQCELKSGGGKYNDTGYFGSCLCEFAKNHKKLKQTCNGKTPGFCPMTRVFSPRRCDIVYSNPRINKEVGSYEMITVSLSNLVPTVSYEDYLAVTRSLMRNCKHFHEHAR